MRPAHPHWSKGRGAGHASGRRGTGLARPPAASPWRGKARSDSGGDSESRGLLLGLLGVAIFALTLPMTRLAVGTPEAPLMSGLFLAMGRAAVAGLLSAALLLWQRAPLPRRGD